MAGFKPLYPTAGRSVVLPVEASASVTKGDALSFDGGYAQLATSADTCIRFVALENCDNSSGADGAKNVNALDVRNQRFEGTTNSTAAQTMVGTYIDLTDEATLNEAASTTNVFFVDEFVDTGTLKGYFVSNVS